MKPDMAAITDRIRHLFFPRRCVICGVLIAENETQPLCASCYPLWQEDLRVPCTGCGQVSMLCRCTRTHEAITDGESVLSAQDKPVRFYYLLPYTPKKRNSAAVRLLLHLKTNRDTDAIRFLGAQMALLCECAVGENMGQGTRDDFIITYAPRSRKAKAVNGYDQSAALARELSRLTGIPLVPCLKRVHGQNRAQKTLNAVQRNENARNSYVLRTDAAAAVKGKRVMLIDDILTTGATLTACASLLHSAGAVSTICVTAAKTVHIGSPRIGQQQS